jgi:hypothetical protein
VLPVTRKNGNTAMGSELNVVSKAASLFAITKSPFDNTALLKLTLI